MRFLTNVKLSVVAPVVVGVVLLASASLNHFIGDKNAEEFLYQMYEFSSVGAIDERYKDIKNLVTEDVYEQVTSMDRTLRAYLRMQGSPSKVNILSKGDGYIIYELVCDAITPGRKFMILYECNIFGKLDKVREMEVADFI